MLLEPATLTDATVLRSDVCVIGAGPAGIVLALELAAAGRQIVLLESGRGAASARLQASADLEWFDPDRHAPTHLAAPRRLGGASTLWGGRCVPFDRLDFDPRPQVPHASWPIDYDELAPHYAAACDYAHCGPPAFDLETALPRARRELVPGFPDGDVISSRLERWSLPTDFGRAYFRCLRDSRAITTALGATCHRIDLDERGGRVATVGAMTMAGKTLSIQARAFVLACGGLENTRLLLNSEERYPRGMGNAGGKLGRFYMGHIFGTIADVCFNTPPSATIFGLERDVAGVYCRRRLQVRAAKQSEAGLRNCVLWLDHLPLADPGHGCGVLSFAYLALATPFIGRQLAPEAIVQALLQGREAGVSRKGHVLNVLKDLPAVLSFVPGFACRRYLPRRKIPAFFVRNRANRYAIHYHGEHAPSFASRVRLGESRDCFGLKRLIVELRYSDQDADSVIRTHDLFARQLESAGCGRLSYRYAELKEAVLRQARDGFHQFGTTRMAVHPADGVVDPDCRVHGTDNLYVCSSSVFPSSSQAHPTLTILALALRLARHLPTAGTSSGSAQELLDV